MNPFAAGSINSVPDPCRLAIILAGGRGVRLGRLGHAVPKCLVQIFDQPLLCHQIDQIALTGVTQVFVVISEAFAAITRAVLSQYQPRNGLRVEVVVESIPLGPVRGLLALAPRVGKGPVLVMLGDEYFEDDCVFRDSRLVSAGQATRLVVSHTRDLRDVLCSVVLDDKTMRVRRLIEKPSLSAIVGDLRWCGVVVMAGGALETAAASLLDGEHLGSLLEWCLTHGYPAEAIEYSGREININTVDDALNASLIAAERSRRSTPEPGAEHGVVKQSFVRF